MTTADAKVEQACMKHEPGPNPESGPLRGDILCIRCGREGMRRPDRVVWFRMVDKVALFHSRIDSRGPDECWPWIGRSTTNDYGSFNFDRRQWQAHRLAYALAKGPIPPGMFVCHRCDNRPCCNPAHLFLGSPLDNMQDMAAKGRKVVKKVSKPNLGAARVREIRQRLAAGERSVDLAKEFGVGPIAIGDIKTRRTWRNV
jgi:hypothetical protein